MDIVLTKKEKSLVITVAILAVVTLVLPNLGSQYMVSSEQQGRSQGNALRDEIINLQNRLATVEDERETIRTNSQAYIDWVEKGVVGEQDPVRWVKIMESVQSSRNLFPLSFRFGDQNLRPSQASPFTENSNVRIRLWDMSLQMEMLHDMDILMFLDELDRRVNSFFFPVECNFGVINSDFSLVYRVNMHSNCRITWLSVDDPGRKI